ncbi:A-kinase anchor protein 12 [Trichomycterus rosablanca]|uniref:A-kinase anchor protein 12 n=1 Tax=Trichomycterus rosablanca TaxID=2290929 RepID=UPI002F351110
MGTSSSSSAQLDSASEGDEEQHAGQNRETEQDTAQEEPQNNGQISSLCQKPNNQAVKLNDQCEERVPKDVEPACVTRKEDAPDTNKCPQEQDVFQESNEDLNNDDATVKEENEVNNIVIDTEFGFKKIFKFGEFKFTLMKDNNDRTDAEESTTNEQIKEVPSATEDSTISIEASPLNTNKQKSEEMQKDSIRGDANDEVKVGKFLISEHTEEITSVKGLMEDVSQDPDPEVALSPVKRFFTQGIWSNLRKRRKEEAAALKESNEDELKRFDKETNEAQSGSVQEDNTCVCLDISHITSEEGKDLQITKRDDIKPLAEKELFNHLEQDVVQTSPFKRLLRKISTRRNKETKPVETDLTGESGENVNENLQSQTDGIKLQDTNEKTNGREQKHSDEELITSHEEKKRSDSIISWESLKCGGSFKKRSRKTSDSEDESQDKEDKPRTTTESPLESSTEGDYNYHTSLNEQTGSSAEDEGSTWKNLKKLVTPKRKSRLEESGSSEQIPSDTEIFMDESSCSLKKLILGHKKLKYDVQKDITSSEGLSKGTETDNKEDETPVIVPLSEYEIVEPESLQVMVTKTLKIPVVTEKEIHFMTEEEKTRQTKVFVKPLYSSGPSIVPIFSDITDDLTEFISKHQQLSDIPEEGIIEESLVTPASFTEWMTQDDTLAEELVDMTADAVTAREHASEDFNGDETSEMVSAVSQLTESPKTSGNVTPVSREYYVSEADLILQETFETICTTPSSQSIAINEKVPEALAMSVSPCITDLITRTETKVFVIHEKKEATSICTGLASKEIGVVQKVIPMISLEGLLEISEAVPTDLVSEHFPKKSKAPEMATDEVYEAESKELEIKYYEAFSVKQNTTDVEALTPDSSLNKALEITEDVAEVAIDEDIKLVAHNVVAPLPNSTLNESSKMTEDVVKLTLAENVKLVANNIVALVPETTLNQESEITGDVQVAFSEDVELVKQDVVASVPDTLNEASKNTKDAVQETQAVDVESVAHNNVAAVPKSTLNEASEIKDNVVQLILAEHTDLLAHNTLTSVSDDTLNEVSLTKPVELQGHNVVVTDPDSTSEMTDNVQVTLAEHDELLAHSAVELVDISTLKEALDIAEDIVQIPQVEYTGSVIHNDGKAVPERMLHEASDTIDVQGTLTEPANLLAHSVVLSVTDSTLNEGLDIIEGFVQVPQTEDVCSDVVSVPGNILNNDPDMADDVQVTLGGDVNMDVVQVPQLEYTEAAIHSDEEAMLDSMSETSEMIDDGQITQPEAVKVIELNIKASNAVTQSTKSMKTDSAETEDVGGPYVDDKFMTLDTPLEDMMEHTKEAKSESEIAKETQESLQTLQTEPQNDTKQLQMKIISSQIVESKASESSCKEAMVLTEASEEKGTNVTTVGAEVTESSLDIPKPGEVTSQTASVTELQETSELKTNNVMEICVEESNDEQTPAGISVKEDIELKSSVFTTTINTVVQTPQVKQTTVVSATQMTAEVQQIKEMKHKIPDADILNASNRKSEKPTVAFFTQLSTPTVTPTMQTPIMILADEMPLEVQKQTVVPTVQTLAVNVAVNEAEKAFAEPEVKKKPLEEADKENIEIKQTYLMEQQVKLTEATEDLIQTIESTANYKGDTNDFQSTSEAFKQHFISMVKASESLLVDDDVWEDAIDNINECSAKK